MAVVPRRRLVVALAVTMVGTGLAASASETTDHTTMSTSATTAAQAGSDVSVRVRRVMVGLDIPWDVAVIPGGDLLVTERSRRRILLRTSEGQTRVLVNRVGNSWASGETGLMSIVVDPRIRRNGRFYTCQGGLRANGSRDVRVVMWQLNGARTSARAARALITGIPVSSGRHGGCRLAFGAEGALYIGTGDAALSSTPQNLNSTGGKVLRIKPGTREPWPTNPYVNHPNRRRRLVYTHGHRNVQGLAQRGSGRMWSVEHGPNRDDEVNILAPRGDYGWQPGPGYDESSPMTDQSLPGVQREAAWSSGQPTVATSGAAWLWHPRWGAWQDNLAVAALKDSSLRVFDFDNRGNVRDLDLPPELNGGYGRLRSVTVAPNGVLYLTTSNGNGQDVVLSVVPD